MIIFNRNLALIRLNLYRTELFHAKSKQRTRDS